jgi:glycine cleavage system H protein
VVNIPSELRYTKDHEWVRVAGSVVRVGITDYAQDALGDVVFVQLPDVGSVLAAQQGLGEIESTKSVSDVYAPVSGKVIAVNSALVDQPELLNSDPYGDGWICEIESTDIDESLLMSAEEYSSLTGSG